jgi:hypothetical protein
LRWKKWRRRSPSYVQKRIVHELRKLSAQAVAALTDYFGWSKGNWGIAEFLAQCSENKIAVWLREACIALKNLCDPVPHLSHRAATACSGTACTDASTDAACASTGTARHKSARIGGPQVWWS